MNWKSFAIGAAAGAVAVVLYEHFKNRQASK